MKLIRQHHESDGQISGRQQEGQETEVGPAALAWEAAECRACVHPGEGVDSGEKGEGEKGVGDCRACLCRFSEVPAESALEAAAEGHYACVHCWEGAGPAVSVRAEGAAGGCHASRSRSSEVAGLAEEA